MGWRHNEQTFDAFSIGKKSIDSLTFNYAYLNGSYTGIQGFTLRAYVYIMNFGCVGAWDNNTFGVSAKGNPAGRTLYGELAYQDEAGITAEEEALYGHTKMTAVLGK